MNPAIPHPEKPAVDAAAKVFLTSVANMRRQDPPAWDTLTPVQKGTVRTWVLCELNAAMPHLARQVITALAADLDAHGEHGAATRLAMIADSWGAAAVPDDLSGLLG